MNATNYYLNMTLSNDDGEISSLMEYSDSDGNEINVCAEGDNLEDVIETIYEQMIDEFIQITEKEENNTEDMTDEQYIEFLEEELVKLRAERDTLDSALKNYNKRIEKEQDYYSLIKRINKYLNSDKFWNTTTIY